jgi:exodeoxyribonuclease VII large subunit
MLQPDFELDFNTDEIYSVSDFLSLCHSTIENNIPICWLRGEISNFSSPTSGHWYFSLKDKKGQVRCAMFRLSQRHIKFIPENGMEVLLQAAPTLYQARGDFQLIIRRIEPVGVGNLQAAFEQLKAKLRDEGLFDKQHKKILPVKVNTIGVVSSSNGAVIQDIIKVLNKRYPFAEILLSDCVVQGEGSAKKLAQAVQAADKYGHCDVSAHLGLTGLIVADNYSKFAECVVLNWRVVCGVFRVVPIYLVLLASLLHWVWEHAYQQQNQQ